MTWTLSLQLFLTQLLQDLWTSAPTGTSSKDLTTLVSQLWLQGTFCNLTPDEIDFFTLILYIILHPNEHCSSSDSNHHQLGAFPPRPDWPLPVSLTITALLSLILAIGQVTVSLRTGHLAFVFPWVSPTLLAVFYSQGAISSALPN